MVAPLILIPAVVLDNPSNLIVLVPRVYVQYCPLVAATPMLLTRYDVPPPALSTNLLKFINVPSNVSGYTKLNDVVLRAVNVQPVKFAPVGSRPVNVAGKSTIVPVADNAIFII